MSRNRETSSIKSIIDKMIDESRLKPGMTEINVKEAWMDLMGPGVAKYTRSIHLRAQVLEVKLDSSVLREELSFGKEKIVRLINEHLGKKVIKDLRLF
jgi:predicted nucleic acid-binding Zn ribbon protein